MPPSRLPSPTASDVLLYRYQHGVNQGTAFIRGPWRDGDNSNTDPGGSKELAEIRKSLQTVGFHETSKKWETRWARAVLESDLSWLRTTARCNAIRLPIGFYTLGPAFCQDTDFEGEPAHLYDHTWGIVKRYVEDCYNHGIGVLIDFHIAPICKRTRELARDCIAFIMQEVTFHAILGVTGIQISNLKDWNIQDLTDWYNEVLVVTSAINPSLPIYISDGGNLTAAADYAASKNRLPAPAGRNPVVIETHRYYNSQATEPQSVIQQVSNDLRDVAVHNDKTLHDDPVDVFVGEYTCTLNPETLRRVDPSSQSALIKQFGQEQGKVWAARASGSAFWALNTDDSDEGTDFKQQVASGAISPPQWFNLTQNQIHDKLENAKTQRAHLRDTAIAQNEKSWGIYDKRHQYDLGWNLGFSDAMSFFSARTQHLLPGNGEGGGGDKIGMLTLWIRKRLLDTGYVVEDLYPEWEQGFRRGVSDFNHVVG
ncbi:glycoside hydrolase [Aspergillus candidus]|uniref:Glycoside hydrolase n=1 Tax=Aspergillus candidus TaxID=41067 RepID=A0A2I2FN24_ASPCN|nr:glycoside hydrolase [Aspergillus candidus]PLB41997.1 glycoside hydrolase [Aspergillus candidus]